jgi:GDP-L-fucose synthase
MKKNSKIYIAGHTGLIGSAMVRKFQQFGYTNLLLMKHEELDLTEKNQTEAFFNEQTPDYVVLAAGRVGGIVENKSFPADFLIANLAIQQNVFNAAHKVGVKKLIFFASSCMYPRECAQPMSEKVLYSGKPEPTSMAYAVSKLAGMQMCLAYNQQYSEQRFIPIIPNSAYGPNDNFNPESGHVLSALINRIHEAKKNGISSVTLWGSGQPRREFIHVDDIADATLALLIGDTKQIDLPINIGVGFDMSIKELAEKIANVIDFTGTIEWDTSKPDGSPRKLLDSSRINKFGWKPSIEFNSGVKNTYQWYVENLKSLELNCE